MAFDSLDRVARFRRQQRLYLAASCVALFMIGLVALVFTIKRINRVPIPPPEPVVLPTPEPVVLPTTVVSKLQPSAPPNPLLTSPKDRPAPHQVNEFLRQEQGRNANRCDLLRSGYQLNIATEFRSHCQPQWDFRDPKREVIWFYHYTSGQFEGRPLTVFGVVDGLGKPLLQHPFMAGDPLALLDSQYQAVKWVALDKPHIALIAAANAPSPNCDQVVDLFLVNDVVPGTQRTWRFGGEYYPEQPNRTFQLICFQDGDGDGYRDVCTLHFVQDSEGQFNPQANYNAFLPEMHTFAAEATPGSSEFEAQLCAIHRDVESTNHQFIEPYLIRATPLEPVFTHEPEPVPAAADTIQKK